ncbi:hypothetical protein [Leptospira borgpetersenii]|uniref:hypothetical protein n=1 Tax=Leptospira borgpetersenii TaxID=174 RepID=UPI00188AA9F2|nr:hypothetical protein [Leptospira borgpetersenii]MBF3378613.1 hypothetical protein [Leptospira borgpetersenii serovar Balcanica]
MGQALKMNVNPSSANGSETLSYPSANRSETLSFQLDLSDKAETKVPLSKDCFRRLWDTL